MADKFVDVKVKASYLDKKGIAHVQADSGGGERTTDYRTLKNKPSINNVTLSGNKSLKDLGIQPEGNYATLEDIPTKVSDLENDSNFIDEETAQLLINANLGTYILDANNYPNNQIDILGFKKGIYMLNEINQVSPFVYKLKIGEDRNEYSTVYSYYGQFILLKDIDIDKLTEDEVIGYFWSKQGATSYMSLGLTLIRYRPSTVSSCVYLVGVGGASFVTSGSEQQTIYGKKVFNVLPESSVTPTTDNQFVNKKYVDDNSSSMYLGNSDDTSYQNPIDITGLKKGVYVFNNESRSTLHISATIHGVKSTTTFNSILSDRGFPFVGPIFLELYKDIDDNITPNSTLGCFSFSYYNHNDYKINVGMRMLNADSAYYISTGSGSGYGVNLVLKDKSITITGTHTYNTLPQSSVVPSSANQLVNKKYVDDSISQAISSALGGDY